MNNTITTEQVNSLTKFVTEAWAAISAFLGGLPTEVKQILGVIIILSVIGSLFKGAKKLIGITVTIAIAYFLLTALGIM